MAAIERNRHAGSPRASPPLLYVTRSAADDATRRTAPHSRQRSTNVRRASPTCARCGGRASGSLCQEGPDTELPEGGLRTCHWWRKMRANAVSKGGFACVPDASSYVSSRCCWQAVSLSASRALLALPRPRSLPRRDEHPALKSLRNAQRGGLAIGAPRRPPRQATQSATRWRFSDRPLIHVKGRCEECFSLCGIKNERRKERRFTACSKSTRGFRQVPFRSRTNIASTFERGERDRAGRGRACCVDVRFAASGSTR
jgi:hypothetical protein